MTTARDLAIASLSAIKPVLNFYRISANSKIASLRSFWKDG
jgi:hypothetical protein